MRAVSATGRPHRFLPVLLIAWALLAGPNPSGAQPRPDPVMVFDRVNEPVERAFSVLVPQGWRIRGGIVRVDPLARGGPAQSIAAKVDFAVLSDEDATVAVRWLPDTLYADMSASPAAAHGLFPPGSHYQGMTVLALTGAADFTRRWLLPALHPDASELRIVRQSAAPEVATAHTRLARSLIPAIDFTHDAAATIIEYEDGGVSYRESLFVVVENWGRAGAGMWGTKDVLVARAPAAVFDAWQPVLGIIQSSVRVDAQWLAGEIRGQIRRGEIAARTMAEIQRIGREITEHRRLTHAEIHNDMFLALTGQEEYVNPFTGEIETGSDHWRHRWENPDGRIIYTDREDYDPNVDLHLNRSDFRRSHIRERFPDSGARRLPY